MSCAPHWADLDHTRLNTRTRVPVSHVNRNGEEQAMRGKRIVATFLALILMSGPGLTLSVEAQSVAAVPPQPPDTPVSEESGGVTPPRVSYLDGEVSFWR